MPTAPDRAEGSRSTEEAQIFTAEHEALRSSIRRWVDSEIEPHVDEWEHDGIFPDDLFKRAGDLGFLGLHYPERWGGSGGDYLTSIVLAEELSRCGAAAILMALAVQTDMATPAINAFGTDWQKEHYLAPAIAGTKIAAIAITEPDAGSDVASIRTTAVLNGDEYVVNGAKMFITNGSRADFCSLVVKTDPKAGSAGISLLLVDLKRPGISVSKPLDKVGMRSSDTVGLTFDDVRVPARNLIGLTPGHGFAQLMNQLQYERLINAVLSVAQARVTLDATVDYVRQREAFGRPLGDLQVVAHKLADVATELEAAHALVYTVVQEVGSGEFSDRRVSMAKKYGAQVQGRVADTCVQLHGGLGFMNESRIARQWRDCRLQRIGAGADEVMNEIIAKRMGLGTRRSGRGA